MNILALDQGTSATKAMVIAETGQIVATAEVPVHPVALPDGGVEQDPEELWSSILEAGREALAEAGTTVDAIGLANQGETVLVWDPRDGSPRSIALSWQDRRATSVCERIKDRASSLRTITGLPLDPYFAAPKMTLLREQLGADGVVSTTDAWLIHRLTGEFVTDVATASRTLLLDLEQLTWSSEASSIFGLAGERLPTIVPNAGVVGMTSAFGRPLPVAGLAVDQQAALFAEACHVAGEAKCTYGTGAFLLANIGATVRLSQSGLATCVAWRIGDTTNYCLDGQVYTAGSAVDWLKGLQLVTAAADLDALGGAVPDAGGVHFVPGLAGIGAPFWNPNARGAFLGLSLATSRAHLVRAVIEGVAASVAWLARAAAHDLGRPLERLRVDGGLTRSATLMQVQADLLQAPLDVYPTPHATAFGVAALALSGIGGETRGVEFARRWVPQVSYEPRISADEADARLDAWRMAAIATIGLAEQDQHDGAS